MKNPIQKKNYRFQVYRSHKGYSGVYLTSRQIMIDETLENLSEKAAKEHATELCKKHPIHGNRIAKTLTDKWKERGKTLWRYCEYATDYAAHYYSLELTPEEDFDAEKAKEPPKFER